MPDWVIHIGAGYLLSRSINREDVSLAVIGSIIADVISRIDVILVDFLHLYIFDGFSFSCFHTPFMLAVLSLVIALFTVRPGRSFIILFAFSMLHLFLDMLEVNVPGFGVLLFFPISYRPYSLGLFNLRGIGYFAVYGIFLLALIWAFFQKRPAIDWTGKRWRWAIPVFLFLMVFPFHASTVMTKHNVGDIQFLKAPGGWDGRKVNLHVSRVVSSSPVVVEERGNRFELVTERNFQTGDWVSVYGTYSEGKITPEIIIPEMGSFQKSFLSGMGLLFLIGFFML